ncbi:MAG: protein kinase domain-containing protein, partial [Planctomycetota bacterium]
MNEDHTPDPGEPPPTPPHGQETHLPQDDRKDPQAPDSGMGVTSDTPTIPPHHPTEPVRLGQSSEEEEPREPTVAGPGDRHRYEDRGEFARGGMGSIRKLIDKDLRRAVAMKVLLEEEERDHVNRFIEEAQITGQLEHPNIVPVHELGRDNEGSLYFTMKMVRGESLEAILERITSGDREILQAYPLSRLLGVFMKACEAIAYAHNKGVIHRDLKPENVMVGSFGEVLVMDWGLAKVRGRAEGKGEDSVASIRSEEGVGKTFAGGIVGTPSHMSPEQANAELDEIDEQSDVWCLGGILYGLLCLHPPYEGKTVGEIIRVAAAADVVPPRKRGPGRPVPPELESICLKAMAKEKADRYPSVEALMRDVQAYQDRRLVSAHRYGLMARLSRWVQRHPTASVGTGITAILCVAGAALTAVLVQQAELADIRAREAEREAEQERVRADVAEVGRETAEQTLEKGRRVSKVLRAADRDLGHVLKSLKRSFTAAAPLAQKRRDGDRLWPEVESFFRGIEPDSASQAAGLAAKGWLRRLAGYEKEAMALFRKSRETDPDIATGWLFEGMVGLARVLSGQSLPPVLLSFGGIRFDEIPPESESVREARKTLEGILERVRKAPVWGESATEDFEAVLQGLCAFQEGNLEMAERGLSAGLSLPETVWMKEELFLARAKVRYLRKRFDAAIRDAEKVVRVQPEDPEAHAFLGQIYTAMGLQEFTEGRGGEKSIEKAIAAFNVTVRGRPQSPHAYHSRGIAKLHHSQMKKDHGKPSEETLRSAIGDFEEALRLHPAFLHARNSRGNAMTKLGNLLGERGEDATRAYMNAIADYSACVEGDPGFTAARLNRGLARQNLGNFQAGRGADPRPLFSQALADFNAVIQQGKSEPEAYNNRGSTRKSLGEYEESRGRDPRPD